MKRMAPFMQQRFHVPLQPRRVHEDKRLAAFLQRTLIPAYLFSLAALQIQIVMDAQLIEIRRKLRREPLENFPRLLHKYLRLILAEWAQWRLVLRIDIHVPWAQ